MDVRIADYDLDTDVIEKIRFNVFVKEQNVPESLEMDDRDPFCIHLLAFDSGKAIGTCRIDIEKQGKVGRLAVLASYRRHGVGKMLMQAIHKIAIQNNLDKVWCHAQVAVIPFYEKLGYQKLGEHFYEANIEHVKMGYIL